jgi:hypothetical protein
MLAVTCTGALHPLIQRDAAMIFALNHRYTHAKLYWFLIELGLPILDVGTSYSYPPLANEQTNDEKPDLNPRSSDRSWDSGAPVGTQAMMERLQGDHFPAFPGGDETGFLDTDIRAFFDDLFQKVDIPRSQVIVRANIARTYGYQIMDGSRIGQRDYYLALAFALGLDVRTTQHMLAVTSAGALHPLIMRDAAIIFGLNHRYDNNRAYWFLAELGLPPLDTGMA